MLNVRPAIMADSFNIRSLIIQAIVNTAEYSSSTQDNEVANFSGSSVRLAISSGLCVVAEEDGDIVGVCMGEEDDGPIWLSWVVVKPTHQRRGIGRSLVQSFMVAVHDLGRQKIWCSTLVSNDVSVMMMESLSWSRVAELKNHWHGLDFYLWEVMFIQPINLGAAQ